MNREHFHWTRRASPNAPPVNRDPSLLHTTCYVPETVPPETRLVVIGDSDFATNGVVGIPGNRDLFLNTVNWLAQQENLISIRAREPEDRRLTLTADEQRRLFWLSLFFVPGFVLGTGVYTWWRRR